MTKDEKQIDWVMSEISKIIKKAHTKKYDCVNVWQGLNQTAIEYGLIVLLLTQMQLCLL